MPTLTKKPDLDADTVFVCVESFAGPDSPVIQRGTRLRGDNPIVRNHPDFFVVDGTPELEWPSTWKRLAAREAQEEAELAAEHTRAAANNRVKLEAPAPPTVLRATHDIEVDHAGKPAMIEKGSTVLENDPLVYQHPDAFEPIGSR